MQGRQYLRCPLIVRKSVQALAGSHVRKREATASQG
jgi:hypothetical protein